MKERASYTIGRGRPPKHTRWKKGQTGNPGRIRRRKSLDAAKLVEAAFRKRIYVTEGGERKRMTVFEAIVLQLWTKAVKANTRAMRVYLQYQDYALANSADGGLEVRVIRDEE